MSSLGCVNGKLFNFSKVFSLFCLLRIDFETDLLPLKEKSLKIFEIFCRRRMFWTLTVCSSIVRASFERQKSARGSIIYFIKRWLATLHHGECHMEFWKDTTWAKYDRSRINLVKRRANCHVAKSSSKFYSTKKFKVDNFFMRILLTWVGAPLQLESKNKNRSSCAVEIFRTQPDDIEKNV